MPTILVVDDNKLSRMMVEQRLTKAGFTVITAESAIEALSRIRSRLISPDLVISDIVMPGMQGYDFCRELRQEPSTAQVPIILLTSKGGVQEKVAGFQAGADDYLVKPVEPAELVMRIRVLLARAKTGEATRETSTDKGKVITVFSLRGGAGVSTVTLNLAIALAQLWETEVSLIDLAMASSHLMMMLDLKPKYTIADLAEYQQSSELDGEAIGGFLTDHESGVRLLAGLHRPELVDLVSPSLVPTALSYLRDRFAYLVIDTDSSFSEHNLEVLDASDVIVLVVNPEMASMQSSTRALDVFHWAIPMTRSLPY